MLARFQKALKSSDSTPLSRARPSTLSCTACCPASLAVTSFCSRRTSSSSSIQFSTDGGGAGAATPGSPQDFTVNVGDRIFFDTDSTSIRADAAATLDRQAQWLQRYPNFAITIEGHADERGTREYNLALGQKRADAIKKMLTLLGAREDQVESVSLGEEKPKNEGQNEAAWAENRRGDMLYSGEF